LDQEIVDIQDLDGVGPVTAGKLRDAGFDSILALAVAPIRELLDKASLDATTASKIVKAARLQVNMDFVTAKQLYERRQNLLRLTLGSNKDLQAAGLFVTVGVALFFRILGAVPPPLSRASTKTL
jgi:nucleotidyltransferase/DNA polymerase involved in DNA repair